MASSRRTATNENISTYDSAGGKDYSTLQGWEEATDIDLVTAAQSEVLECYKGAHSDNDTIDGATTNSSYFRIIRPAPNEGHSGIPKSDGSCVEFNTTNDFQLIKIAENYFSIQDIVLKLTPNSANNRWVLMVNAPNAITIIGCLIYDSANAGTGSVAGIYLDSGTGANATNVINCLVHNVEGAGVQVFGTTEINLYNTTIDSTGGYSITGAGAMTLNMTNTIYTDYSVAGTINITTSLDVDVSPPSYIDSANDDFHLSSSDTAAKDQGTDLSADPNFDFTDDVDASTRSGTWDIGFDEYISAIQELTQTMAGGGVINGTPNKLSTKLYEMLTGGLGGGAFLNQNVTDQLMADGGISGGEAERLRQFFQLMDDGGLCGGSIDELKSMLQTMDEGGIGGGSADQLKLLLESMQSGGVGGGVAELLVELFALMLTGGIGGGAADITTQRVIQLLEQIMAGGGISGGLADQLKILLSEMDKGGIAGGSADIIRLLVAIYLYGIISDIKKYMKTDKTMLKYLDSSQDIRKYIDSTININKEI